MANTIKVKGDPINKEAIAAAVMKPGYVVMDIPRGPTSPGAIAFVGALGDPALGVVLENEYEGTGITTSYAAGDNVNYGVFPRGSEVLLRLPAAAPAVAVGKALTPKVDGTVQLATIGLHHVVATAIQAVDNSVGGTEVFILCSVV